MCHFSLKNPRIVENDWFSDYLLHVRLWRIIFTFTVWKPLLFALHILRYEFCRVCTKEFYTQEIVTDLSFPFRNISPASLFYLIIELMNNLVHFSLRYSKMWNWTLIDVPHAKSEQNSVLMAVDYLQLYNRLYPFRISLCTRHKITSLFHTSFVCK